MRKKLLTLLLAISTISSTLVPAQSVFADTTGNADVSIEEAASDDQPSSTSRSTRLFPEEVTEENYKKLANIKYEDIPYGNKTRSEIDSEVALKDIKAKTVQDAYPISHEDIYIPETELCNKKGYEEYRNQKEKSTTLFPTQRPRFKYKFNGIHYDFEITKAAKEYIESQQPTYHQESGDCTYNAFTELANKALIKEDLIHQEDVHKIRMSRAQIEYNGLFITEDPLNGFHGDYAKEGYDTREVKFEIRKRLGSKHREASYDLRRQGSRYWIMRSLYSGMGPVKEADVNDSRALNLCNGEADVVIGYDTQNDPEKKEPTPKPIFKHTTSDDLHTEDVYYTKKDSNNHYAHLTQTRIFPGPTQKPQTTNAPETTNDQKTTNDQNRKRIKAWIYKYGGVGLNMKFGTDKKYPEDFINRHYNFEKNCLLKFYDDNPTITTSHEMTIVGWDDTFPAEAFKSDTNETINNGAWLVKNSWNQFKEQQDPYGTEMVSNEDFSKSTPFSYYRYFWLSYDSPDINEYYGIAFENNDYFDNIYQYDGYQENSEKVSTSKAANIFTVKDPDTMPSSDKAQELKCVGFEICNEISSPAEYKVEIYRNIPEGGSPTDGTLVNTKTGTCPVKGIYTVELEEPVTLAHGERFSVVVTLENEAQIAVEDNRTYENDALNDPRENHRGESYIYSDDSNKWKDVVDVDRQLTKEWPENVRIKAMTVNTDTDSSTIRATLPPASPTPAPISDCAELTVKAKVTDSLTGFEYSIETKEDSPLTDQIKYVRITTNESNGKERSTLNNLPEPKIKSGTSTRSVFLPIDPDRYEDSVKVEILDSNKQPLRSHLSGEATGTYHTSYTTSMREYLDKLKETAIANNDTITKDFANALLIHMACAQNTYKTKTDSSSDIDLSALAALNKTDFSSYKLARNTTNANDTSLKAVGISFSWKKTDKLSVTYNVTNPSLIKSIQIDGEEIMDNDPKSYQFEQKDDHYKMIVNLSDIPISEFVKSHIITINNTNNTQYTVKVSVYSYIYATLCNACADSSSQNYAKSLAFLKKSYDQLDKNDSRYRKFFLF